MVGFNGFVDSQASSISQYETGNNSSNTAMALAATSTTAGAGTITTMGGPAFDFAFDASHFRRSDGTNDQCFDRSLPPTPALPTTVFRRRTHRT